MTQYLRPISDIATNGWVTTPLWPNLDEVTYNDGDSIRNNSVSYCEVGLSSANDPQVSSNHVVNYRLGRSRIDRTLTAVVSLMQGTTTIASWTHVDPALSYQSYSQTLTAGQADAITNYADLRLRFQITAIQNTQVQLDVSWAEVNIPDAPAGSTYTLTCDKGFYSVTGESLLLSVNRKLQVTKGSYSVTGESLLLSVNRKLQLNKGSYSLTGQILDLVYTPTSGPTYILTCDKGLYFLTGESLSLHFTRNLQLTKGLYSLTGESLLLSVSRKLQLTKGVYSLTGESLLLSVNRKLQVTKGSYSLSGESLLLSVNRKLQLTKGSYFLTGRILDLVYTPLWSPTYVLLCTKGSYSLTGESLLLSVSRKLQLNKGSYSLTGENLSLSVHRKLQLVKGLYSLTGENLLLSLNRKLWLSKGLYLLSERSINLEFKRNLLIEKGLYSITERMLDFEYTPIPPEFNHILICDKGYYLLLGRSSKLFKPKLIGELKSREINIINETFELKSRDIIIELKSRSGRVN